jgi:hypothetical protein
MGLAISQCYSAQSPYLARGYVLNRRSHKRRMDVSFVARSIELFACRHRQQVRGQIKLPLGLITPGNELHPKSYWTASFSAVRFALKAAALSPCRKCICHVGPRFISAVTSSRFFGRNASVQPPLFLRCFSSYLWLRWHRVHRSTPALTQSKAFSPALSQRLQVWLQS